MVSDPDSNLPLRVIDSGDAAPAADKRQMRRRAVWVVPVIWLSLLVGGVVGLYFQPPGLRAFFEATGLQPAGGTDAPFALPAGVDLPEEVVQTLQPSDVVGLARLMPRGDISVVAPPFGAGDARIADILVEIGEDVARGQTLAVLDNLPELEGARTNAGAEVGIRRAILAQTRQSVTLSISEDRASLAEAEAAARVAEADRTRTRSLFARGIATQAQLDQAEASAEQSLRAVDRARATLARYETDLPDEQPDVLVAQRNLEAAEAALRQAERDLAKARVVAPRGGRILDIYGRPGEAPSQDGIMVLGDVSQMMAEIEVHQTQIADVMPGQPVEMISDALKLTLTGRVAQIGQIVARQDIVADDTAAITDARIVKVLVALDEASSPRAERYTNLEVIARIDAREVPE